MKNSEKRNVKMLCRKPFKRFSLVFWQHKWLIFEMMSSTFLENGVWGQLIRVLSPNFPCVCHKQSKKKSSLLDIKINIFRKNNLQDTIQIRICRISEEMCFMGQLCVAEWSWFEARIEYYDWSITTNYFIISISFNFFI